MAGKFFGKKGLVVSGMILFFFFCAILLAQENQTNDDKKLRGEILTVFKDNGEKGLRNFIKDRLSHISKKFILDLAESGVKERKEKWLNISKILAEEKKDEKILAEILFKLGYYFRLVSNHHKSREYLGKALPIYMKLNDFAGQGNIYLEKGTILFADGDTSGALNLYEEAMVLFQKGEHLVGQGNFYLRKGIIYHYTGDNAQALLQYDNALPFFEKSGHHLGQGNIYFKKGEIYYYTGDNVKAMVLYKKALNFYKQVREPMSLGNVYRRIADIYLYTGEYSKALETYEKAFSFFEKAKFQTGQGDVYRRKGDIYFIYGKNSRSLEFYKKALSFFENVGNSRGKGHIYRSMGDIFLYTGKYSDAYELYETAMPFFKEVKDLLGQASVYWRWGDVSNNLGETLKALVMYAEALRFYEKTGNAHGQGNMYLQKGHVYKKIGDLTRAIDMYNKALPFFEKMGNPIGLGGVHFRIGEIYFQNKKISNALKMFEKALHFYEKGESIIGQGNIYWSRGEVHLNNGNCPEALKMYKIALSFFDKLGNPLGQANVYKSIGDTYLKSNDRSKALLMYNRAQEIYTRIGELEGESFVLHERAKILAMHKQKDKSLFLFKKAIANLEKVRTLAGLSEMRRTYIERTYEQYEEVAEFMLDNHYYEKGFKYAEMMKARSFLDQLAEGMVRLDKGITRDLKQKRDNLVSKLSITSKEIAKVASDNNEEKLKELKEKYRQVEEEFKELLVKIRVENHLYSSVRYPQPVSLKDLQKNVLKKKELLLRYFLTKEKVYVFLISKNSYNAMSLEVNKKNIREMVEQYLLAVKLNNSTDVAKYGKFLYMNVFKPLEKWVKGRKSLIIVPDGDLVKIPFESFVLDIKKSGEPIYLLEKYHIKYVQSATVLKVLRKHYHRKGTTKHFIGFGDPVYDYEKFKNEKSEKNNMKRSQQEEDEIKRISRGRYFEEGGLLKRLKTSGEEIKTIAGLFEKKAQKSIAHLRDNANEMNAKSPGLKEFDFIHFSCHGILGDGFQSLVLSQLPESQEDGFLTLNEIMNCEYHAKLVVLSACQTGKGKMVKGEGVVGLTRAVMYAGTPAVVASLWKVDDMGTKELMVRFYENMLKKKMDKEKALRKAKLKLIKSKTYSSPFFWGAFIMYGE